ncbi:mating pair formation protein [Caballeronia sordidicola]|uniref:Mating pair formation protein n=1 Tax=Caballeronia sordidicola TaxID=196367 RepID=A0A242N499_CABSO|nr:mating pair formation protein [Caballeronia sordidicola]OTP78498.1 hypothetical protein PAMC26577_04865 [Caballeronia sordidicola]
MNFLNAVITPVTPQPPLVNSVSDLALSRSQVKYAAALALLFVTALFPEYAYAADYSTFTDLLRGFVSWLFVDAGPYIFMAILGICVVGVPKGWVPMKSAVIATVVTFVFFALPTVVRYAATTAASNI